MRNSFRSNAFVTLFFVYSLPLTASASDIGISVGFGGSNRLAIPIKTNHYLYEPEISHRYSEAESDTNYNESESIAVGLSAYRLMPLESQFTAQVGLGVKYVNFKSNSGRSGSGSEFEGDGFELSPGFGLFYRLVDNFEVGALVHYRYSEVSEDETYYYSSDGELMFEREKSDRTIAEVDSQLQVRLFF